MVLTIKSVLLESVLGCRRLDRIFMKYLKVRARATTNNDMTVDHTFLTAGAYDLSSQSASVNPSLKST